MKDKEAELSVETVKEFCKEAQEILTIINSPDGSEIYYWYIAETLEKCLKLIKAKKVVEAELEFKFMLNMLKREVGL